MTRGQLNIYESSHPFIPPKKTVYGFNNKPRSGKTARNIFVATRPSSKPNSKLSKRRPSKPRNEQSNSKPSSRPHCKPPGSYSQSYVKQSPSKLLRALHKRSHLIQSSCRRRSEIRRLASNTRGGL